MPTETMTGYERYYGALSQEYVPDRCACVVAMHPGGCAMAQGVAPGAAFRDPEIMKDVCIKTVEQIGTWDADTLLSTFYCGNPYTELIETLIPGVDLADDVMPLCIEREVMTLEDYDNIIEANDFEEYFKKVMFPRTNKGNVFPEKSMAEVYEEEKAAASMFGMELAYSSLSAYEHPIMFLSLARSFNRFTEDLYFRKEKTKKVMQLYTDFICRNIDEYLSYTGNKVLQFCDERSSAANYSLQIFEEFWIPYMQQVVDVARAHGATIGIHCDTNWIKNMPYFKQFPEHAFNVEFDSTTPIKEVYEQLGNWISYYGDVNGALLSYGKPEEVTAYCKDLVDSIGRKGGLILACGCNVPWDAKIENLIAMKEVAENYWY